MNDHVDSKSLFVRQVGSHSQSLCELLTCDTVTAAPSNVIERCSVATRMLAGTSSLMGLLVWEQVMTAYEELLVRYNEMGLLWDDRIAQFTSELIEKEETLVSAHEGDPTVVVEEIVTDEELGALLEEAAVLHESALTVPTVPDTPPPPPQTNAAPSPAGTTPQASTPPQASAPPPDESSLPMRGVITELEAVYQSLIGRLHSGRFGTRDTAPEDVAAIRHHLFFLDFYACSLEQMIERQNPSIVVDKCSLLPLKTVLNDFANEVSATGDNVLDVVLNGEDTPIDPRLLPVAGAVLQCMITDVFSRSEGTALGVVIDVFESRGAIRWRLADNGNNFISDSQLDHEDQLAFYPGLKRVRKLLGRHHGVLWVEPRDDGEVRFEFSIPASKSDDSYMVWGKGAGTFGVRSVQLCDLLPVAAASIREDSFGEFLTIDKKRVPLLRLDAMFEEAPSGGDTIAVIGSLEKRVAFYAPEAGSMLKGKALDGGISAWQGPAHLVAQVNGGRIALLDAERVLEGYLNITGNLNAEGVSGGVVDDESDLSNSQASFDSDEVTPPDQFSEADDGGDVEVLVVEQSESLRGELINIFNGNRISAAFAGGIDEAFEVIHARAPRIIISEFRMPTMAAKVLVEALGAQGNHIPVLVTTSQSGKTADLLVEKLGAAGYLSKPLDQKEVVDRISGFLTERAQA